MFGGHGPQHHQTTSSSYASSGDDSAVRQIPPSAASSWYRTVHVARSGSGNSGLVLDASNSPARKRTENNGQQRLLQQQARQQQSSDLGTLVTQQQQQQQVSSSWSRLIQRTIFQGGGSREENARSNQPHRVHFTENDQSQSQPQYHNDPTVSLLTSPTAARFAQSSPMAGFLHKYGQRVPEFKRRFFVLQPATHLYYFLSPNDSQPRGCLDLQDSWIETPSGSNDCTEFAICWPPDAVHGNITRRVVLQAKSAKQAQEWIDCLKTQRLDVAQKQLATCQNQLAGYKARIHELETKLDYYKLMEQDRDLALQDAEAAQRRFQSLDQSLQRLAEAIRQTIQNPTIVGPNSTQKATDDFFPPISVYTVSSQPTPKKSTGEMLTNEQNGKLKDETKILTKGDTSEGEKNDSFIKGDPEYIHNGEGGKSSGEGECNQNQMEDTRTFSSLSFFLVTADIENLSRNFGSLVQACQTLERHWGYAVRESSTVVEDLTALRAAHEAVQKRLGKAEHQLLKLWEENVEIRKQLRQRKKEKKVLVQEVRNLQQKQHSAAELPQHVELLGSPGVSSLNVDEEEQLLNELEQHISASIELHEKNLRKHSPTTNKSMTAPEVRPGGENIKSKEHVKSLFDCDDDDNEDDAGEIKNSLGEHDTGIGGDMETIRANMGERHDWTSKDDSKQPQACFISSLRTSNSNNAVDHCPISPLPTVDSHSSVGLENISTSSAISTPDRFRSNPLLQLDETVIDESQQTNSRSRPTLVINSGQATSALSCPLADVTGRSPGVNNRSNGHHSRKNNPLQVYHLTFYSRKIGIQFQKVPPPPQKARGLLTEAMAADLEGTDQVAGNRTTSAELRRIAKFSSLAKLDDGPKYSGDQVLEVASPVDAVLVCGFQGFDETSSNVKPKLGARLVAFDGVSVETGKWTFESIRKAIQMRSRPLTLSFRDDFLTTEQRQILTKAIREIDESAHLPKSQPIIQHDRNSGGVHSISTASIESQEVDTVVDEGSARSTLSVRSVRFDEDKPPNFLPVPTRKSDCFRSFSEAGSASSSSIISAVGPIMANLLYDRSSQGSDNTQFTPQYMRRPQVSVEDTPQHRDFKAGLL